MHSDSDEGQPFYNSRIVDLFIRLVKAEYPRIDTDRLLGEVGMKSYEVTDLGHWFARDQVDRLVERLVQLTGNEQISRDAGRYAASPAVIGAMRRHLLGVISPEKAFSLIHKATRNVTRAVDYKLRMVGAGEVELTVTPAAGMTEKKHHCANRIGFLEAIVRLFNVESPAISHPHCVLGGDPACRYLISWKEPRSAPRGGPRSYALPTVLAANLVGLVFSPTLVLTALAPASTLLLLTFALWSGRLERHQLRARLANLQESTEGLVDQLNLNYNQSRLAAEIAQVLSSKVDVDGILEAVRLILQERLAFDRGIILLTNEERSRLCLKAAFGAGDELLKRPDRLQFHLDRAGANGFFVQAFYDRKPLLVEDISAIEGKLSARSLTLVKGTGTRSFISCPIACDGEAIGILAVDNFGSDRPLSKSDMALLVGIAPIIGISIHNARLLEQRAKQFDSTLQVLSASIDARDFLTAGHSEAVTRYSVGICRELGLSAEQTELIRVAAMLHDYGKIGVPDFILKKNGRLTDAERALVQTHPSKTREILESINFEGIYRQIPNIAGAHHEKIDGSGYPHGLKGDEIPLGSRVIAVADFFEAITAKRHYRGPMSVETALSLLREGSGSHFEPSIVGALINYVTQCSEFALAEDDAKKRFFHRHVRVPCRSHVSCRVGRRTIAGASSNLSKGGLFIAAEEPVAPDDLLDVIFSLPKTPERLIKVKGRVAWVNPKNKISPLPVGFGVQFVALSRQESTAIGDFIDCVFAAA